MKVIVELHSDENTLYNQTFLATVAQETLKSSGKIISDEMQLTISVALVDDVEIQRINREFRQKDCVTDVISVGDYSDDKDISTQSDGKIFLGEIILCYNYIVQIAKENDTNINREFFTVYAHGILHLLGLKHGKKMYDLQEQIAEKFSVV